MTDKEHYILLNEKQNSVFAKSWWLNACCGNENWKVIFSSEKKSSFAFHEKQKLFQKAVIPSILTPYQPCLNADEEIIKALSSYNFVELYWKYFTENQIQLLKKYKFEIGFKSTRILDVKNLSSIYQNFKPSLKRQIKKAEELVKIEEDFETENLYTIVQQVFNRQNKPLPFSKQQLDAITNAASANNCCKIYVAKNHNRQLCAAIMIVWDEQCCYYLAGGISTEFKNTGAMSLLIWKAIQFAAMQCAEFDFCGSTISSIDNFFSTFGAIKHDVLVINKYNNRFQKWVIDKVKK